ncbi:MAG: hypothetical protein WAW23_12780 [Candidatus Methanoperedens sp.]
MSEDLTVNIWEERDRLGVWVDDCPGNTVFEVWDDNARQMFEDGFFKRGKGFEESVIEYVKKTVLKGNKTKEDNNGNKKN